MPHFVAKRFEGQTVRSQAGTRAQMHCLQVSRISRHAGLCDFLVFCLLKSAVSEAFGCNGEGGMMTLVVEIIGRSTVCGEGTGVCILCKQCFLFAAFFALLLSHSSQ